MAAARLGQVIGVVVSRGGRPDLAGALLPQVLAPTLLIVGGRDDQVIRLNEAAYAQLQCEKALRIVPGATHLLKEPGALDEVARLATEWFQQHLQPSSKALPLLQWETAGDSTGTAFAPPAGQTAISNAEPGREALRERGARPIQGSKEEEDHGTDKDVRWRTLRAHALCPLP